MSDPLMANFLHALETYIDAKDQKKAGRLEQVFAPEAVLTMVLETESITFPPMVVGVDAIERTLVTDFGARFEACRTYLIEGAALSSSRGCIDGQPWVVVMRDLATASTRVGCGTYRFTFGDKEPSKVSHFRIQIACMDLIPDSDSGILAEIQEALAYPWVSIGALTATFDEVAGKALGLECLKSITRRVARSAMLFDE